MQVIKLVHQPCPMTVTILDSGLVIMVAEAGGELVRMSVVIRTGSFQDGDIPGQAHFLEHVIPGGTDDQEVHPFFAQLRPKGVSRPRARTGLISTEYDTMGYASDVEEIFKSLTQMVFNPVIRDEILRRERGAILQEVQQYLNDDMRMNWRSKRIYKDAPEIFDPVLGYTETVSAMTSQNLQEFHQKHYGTENTAIIVSGGINHEEILDLVLKNEQLFCSVSPIINAVVPVSFVRDKYIGKLSYSYLNLIFSSPFSRIDNELYSLGLICLEDMDFGPLYRRLRKEMGIIYGVGSGQDSYPLTATSFTIPAAEENFDLIEEVFFEEAEKLCSNGLSDYAWQCISKVVERNITESFSEPDAASFIGFLRARFLQNDYSEEDIIAVVKNFTQQQVFDLLGQAINRDRYARLDYIPSRAN